MASTLVIDFHGPIAFRFCKNVAWAYVPQCDYHTGNILTDTDDVSPKDNETYEVIGPKAAKGKTQSGTGARLISVDWKKVKRGKPPEAKDCYWIFKLSLPDRIFGLNAEYVKITGSGIKLPADKYARGLRFCYDECDSKPKIRCVSSSKDIEIEPRYFQQSKDPQYRIEIRYHDINPIEPRPHADADLCSASMRKLFPPLDKWTVDFDPSGRKARPSIEHVGGGHGVDCGANALVFGDGGI
jgi:hypothetical protein